MRLAPTVLLLAACGAALPASAQVVVPAGADARQRPGGGQVLAAIEPGATVTRGVTSGGDTQVTIEGWVDASRLGASRDSFPATVSGRITLRVRAQPNLRGDIVATLRPGVGVHTVSKQGTWTRVRRALWIQTSALASSRSGAARSAASQAKASPPVDDSSASRKASVAPARGIVAATGASLRNLPVGSIMGGLSPGSSVDVIGRQTGWVRVRVEGWLPEKDLLAGDSVIAPSVRAADLRADPAGMKGRVVQWDVEVMAFQNADPLRVEMTTDEPYLLARGPGAENVVLYLAIPPNLLAEARAIPPLTRVSVTARVRSGRSEPAGTPILDLLTIVRR